MWSAFDLRFAVSFNRSLEFSFRLHSPFLPLTLPHFSEKEEKALQNVPSLANPRRPPARPS